jgi:hypothetical protein
LVSPSVQKSSTQPRLRTSTREISGIASCAPIALDSTWLSGDVRASSRERMPCSTRSSANV